MRDKLIELLSEAEKKHYKLCSSYYMCNGCPSRDVSDCRKATYADHLIANGVTIGKDNNVPTKWIPVSERLPEPFEIAVVWDNDDARLRIGVMDGNGDWFVGGFNMGSFSITHWMPLPEPPKGE